MDSNEVRRMRLKNWIDTEFDGRVAALCRYYGLPSASASYLSQLLSGYRSFGERAARKLEAQCRRPSGWLDISPSPAEEVEVLRFDRQRCAKLRIEDRELIEAFITLVLDRSDRASATRFSEVKLNSGPSHDLKNVAKRPVRKPFTEQNHATTRKRSKAG